MKKKVLMVVLLLLLVGGGSIGIYYFTTNEKDNDVEEKNSLDDSDNKIMGTVYRVGYLSEVDETTIDKVIGSYDDFKEYFTTYTNYTYDGYGNIVSSKTDEILNKYDEEFFEEKSLAVKYVITSSGSATIKEVYGIVDSDKVTIRYLVDYPELGTADMSGFFLILEVDKSVLELSLN